MENNNLLRKYITTWYDHKKIIMADEIHLQENELFEMALPGGLGTAEEKSLDHLSLCPVCMDRLEEFRTISETESPEDFWGDAILMGVGGLKAASDDKLETLTLKSRCGRFLLSVFPSQKEDAGTVVLKISSGAPDSFEGKMVTLCDAAGNLIVQGVIREGSLARKVTQLGRFDLKQWNAIITLSQDGRTADSHD